MGFNLPDISQIGRDAATTVATSVVEEYQNSKARAARRSLHGLAKRLFNIDQSEFALKSYRLFDRTTGKRRWIHDLVPRTLSMPERRDIAQKLAVAFPNANRATRRKMAFSGSWMVLV